ncbi:hypothetical protein SBBP2_2940002 [Burkholderiales bacterium]|nr:hypothetical protein SBBP2_2940002 [Burkholderiales bacterium]
MASGTSTSTNGKSIGSIRNRLRVCGRRRANSSGRDCATCAAMRVKMGCSTASGTGASSRLGIFCNSECSGDEATPARGEADMPGKLGPQAGVAFDQGQARRGFVNRVMSVCQSRVLAGRHVPASSNAWL